MRDGMLARPRVRPNGLALAEAASIPVPGPVGVLDALGAAALARAVDVPAGRDRRGAAVVPRRRRTAPSVVAVDRRGHLRRRLQGHQPARGAGVDRGLPAGGLGRRRSAQGRVRRRTGQRRWRIGWSGRCWSAGTGRWSANALSRHAPDVPVVEVVTGEDSGVQGASEIMTVTEDSVTRLMTAVVDAAARLGRPGRHRAAGPGRGVLRPVQRLRPARRCVRRGRARADPVAADEQHADPVAAPGTSRPPTPSRRRHRDPVRRVARPADDVVPPRHRRRRAAHHRSA